MDIQRLLEQARTSESSALSESDAKRLLGAYQVPVIDDTVVTGEDDAVRAAEEIGYPVVLKGTGATLLHKTELGLVHLNLPDAHAVRYAARSIAERAGDALEGFVIQQQVTGRRELVAGMFRDPMFGPVVMFGLGGIFTEALQDVTFRAAPLDESDAVDMLNEIRSRAILGPFRGEEAVDRNQLVQTLLGLSRLAMEYPEIAEIDINPLMAMPTGEVNAVDALVVVRETPSAPPPPPAVDPKRIRNFFHPRSIAFVGASARLGKWGNILFAITASSGYEGDIYLVNPRGGTIAGREVYTSVADIPGPVDLAVVTIPAAGVMDLVPLFQEKGIRNMLLITSGFAETGPEGRKLEQELMAKARAADILVLGPNTMGICNPHIHLYCTGSHVWPIAGSTAVVAQSGNMGTQLLAFAENQGIGVRCFAGSGNEGMITIEDYLEAFEQDDKTRIVMLYIESVKNGRRFLESARRVSETKPIILMKGGRSQAGNKAAASHTGALSSDVGVFDGVCRQAGIVQVQYPTDLLDLSAAFSSLPLPKGTRAAIMTLGGGWGVVTADLCAQHGLQIPELSPELVKRIDQYLPPYWSRSNPVDIVGEHGPEVAINVLQELVRWDGCDAVINLGLIGRKELLGRVADSVRKADPGHDPAFLDGIKKEFADFEEKYIAFIANLMEKHQKPVYGVSLSFDQDEQTVYRVDNSRYKGVFYPTPERAVKAFAEMYRYYRFLIR